MDILFIGDIFGRPGREAVKKLVPSIVRNEGIDFVIANIENAAGGKGITPKLADELFNSSIDVMTSGNHIWERQEIYSYLETHNILRPLNLEEEAPGRGWCLCSKNGVDVMVVSLQGRVFMDTKGRKPSNPFLVMDNLLNRHMKAANIIVVDFHAEATSEKRALAWYLNGRVSAVIGTHTHVQTSDEEVLSGGTAYITDVGMTGPHASVIGLDKDIAIRRFLNEGEVGFKVSDEGVRLECVKLKIDEKSGKALAIERRRYLI